MGFTNSIKMSAMKTAFGYIEKNPEENLLKLLGWVDKLAGDGPDSFPAQRAASAACWKTRTAICTS